MGGIHHRLPDTGFEAVHVPYKGNAEVVMGLVGGQIQAGFLATPGVLQLAQEGRLKALAVSSQQRAPLAPQIPTIEECGYPKFEVSFYQVMSAPKNVPEPIRALLEREVRRPCKSPMCRRAFVRKRWIPLALRAPKLRPSSRRLPNAGKASSRHPRSSWSECAEKQVHII